MYVYLSGRSVSHEPPELTKFWPKIGTLLLVVNSIMVITMLCCQFKKKEVTYFDEINSFTILPK
jgi:hypothetical protein